MKNEKKERELENIMYSMEPDEDGVIRDGDLIMGVSVMRLLLKDSGSSMRGTSRIMGRNDNYMAITLSKSTRPGIELVTEVADTLGYDLQIVNRSTGEVVGHIGYLDPKLRHEQDE